MQEETLNVHDYAAYLAPRPRDWHKGLSGHVLIVGGELGYSGAPRLAAEAALRVGAGLVSVATRAENAVVMNVARPEIMCHGVLEASQLEPLVSRASVIVLGPGLSTSAWAVALWDYCIQQALPLVVDADGLNLLAKTPFTNDRWVLTPHPGEAGRLLEISTDAVQADRMRALRAIQQRYRGVCVLKGAGTLVLAGDSSPAICHHGNPGMASAGMGDVLSGVIGGLIAQGVPLHDAAKLGVVLHAMAGDMAAKASGERGLIASDLMPYLHQLVNRVNSRE